jgi:hypothetical protein
VYAIQSPPGLISADETFFIPRISSGVTGPAERAGAAREIASARVSARAGFQLGQGDILSIYLAPVEGLALERRPG